MYKLKTQETDSSVQAVLDLIDHPGKRADAMALVDIFSEATGFPPRVWGAKQIGFGQVHYQYPTGHQGDIYIAGFAVSKAKISLYLSMEEAIRAPLLQRLGKATAGKGCVYINKLADIGVGVLKEMIAAAVRFATAAYPSP